MAIVRTLAGLTLAATAALALTAQTAHAASDTWGPYHAPGKAAKAAGTLTATGEDHADLPTADVVRISGKVQDNTRGAACGWAVFRITYRSGNELPNRERWARDCSYGSPKKFSFKHRDVYQVELKVCSEAKAAKPSLTCLYAGTWKTLYLSK
ncbi:hypothetical protein FXF51_58250 [Nonomuraea sp. PA05]|uniref:hypothetical protein n=1 Tax=Nonomuraea sp. PA05 TaxID=2604466 RepID=UPI0011D92A12|nr:hypothetical protein [Nonomuraea sp. PA05]TYB47390.1 hypothetical protein FXF51_58250 [Nonomuraea sp. PA05]